jgi:hypothetical protein
MLQPPVLLLGTTYRLSDKGYNTRAQTTSLHKGEYTVFDLSKCES